MQFIGENKMTTLTEKNNQVQTNFEKFWDQKSIIKLPSVKNKYLEVLLIAVFAYSVFVHKILLLSFFR